MEFAINMTWLGAITLAVGSVALGVLAQFVGPNAGEWEFLGTAIGAFVGAIFASEFIVDLRTFEPVWEGVALLPAVVGGVLVGLATTIAMRWIAHRVPAAHGPTHA